MNPPAGPVPPAPPAAVPPGAPAGPAAAPQLNYTSYYDDDAHDITGGQYAGIMNTFVVPAANAPAPQVVSEAVYAAAVEDPQAFILLISDATHPHGRVTLFHRLQRYAPQLGNPTDFDGNGYAFYGDLVSGQAPPSVEWPANAFHQAGAPIRVPTRAAIDQALAADPTFALFDPPDPADAGTEIVRVRQTMLVPFHYVRLLLAHPLSPREAWIQVAGAIYNDNRQAACEPLLDWLRVTLVRQGANQPSRLARDMPDVPLATPALIQRRWALVTRDLPLLSGAPAAAAGNAIAAGINALVTDNRQHRQADETRREEESVKTPEKYFGQVGAAKLLRLCQVANSAALPQLWLDLARAPKKQALVTIQQAFDHMANDTLNMPGTRIPITPDIATKICSLSFEMTDEDDFTTGIQPFTFGYQDQAEIAAAYELAERYQLVQQGQGAPSLTDAAEFTATTRTKLARTLTEATICYGNFRIALHVLLGPTHVVTAAFDEFWTAWQASQPYLLNIRTRTPGLFPALTVRWVQLRASLWFAQQATQHGNWAAPNFVQLLVDIRLQTLWEPYIPDQYLIPQPQPPPQLEPRFPTLTPPAQPLGPTPRAPGSQAQGTPTTPAAGGRGTLERKSAPRNQVFQPFVDLPVRVKDVLERAGAQNRPPENATGVEMCLSYHIKGMCNTACRRRGDHRDHTPAEDESLLGWCRQHYKSE